MRQLYWTQCSTHHRFAGVVETWGAGGSPGPAPATKAKLADLLESLLSLLFFLVARRVPHEDWKIVYQNLSAE